MLNPHYYFFLILSLVIFHSSCTKKNNQIEVDKNIVANFEFETVKKLNDYSFINSWSGENFSAHPKTPEEAAKAIKDISDSGKKIRIRGRGHSMSGISIPDEHSNEILLLTYDLDYYEVLENGYVKLGAGISMYAAQNFLKELGLDLRVINDGNMHGPSVGGYLSAGGFGVTSETFGGFWETVQSLTMIDGLGNIHTITRNMPEFKWFFGSMGQLGLIVDVTIQVDGSANKPQKGHIPYTLYAESPMLTHPSGGIFWFTAFAPPSKEENLKSKYEAIKEKHPKTLDYLPDYHYTITFKEFNPPMLYPKNETFKAIGIWGTPKDVNNIDTQAIRALEKDFHTLITSDPELYRYIQTEYLSEKNELSDYYPNEIKQDFFTVKNKYDPKDIFPNHLTKQ